MPDPTDPDAMTPEDAMSRMASITSMTSGLRVRTEGLTLVVWALCLAASYLTIAVPILNGGGPPGEHFNGTANGSFNGTFERHGPRDPPSTLFFLSRFAPLIWFVIATVVTIAIWRSASLSFRTGMSTPRIVGVLVGWLALFVVATIVLTYSENGRPQASHIAAWTVVAGLFAALNPLRFTRKGRLAVAGVTLALAVASLYAYFAHLGPRDASFLSGVGLGLPTLVAGLYLMFRG